MFQRKKWFVTSLTLMIALTIILAGCQTKSSSESAPPANSSSAQSSSAAGSAAPSETPSTGPQRGGHVTIALGADISNFDPIKGSNGGDHVMLWPVYDTLVKFTPDLQAKPGLAQHWEFIDDKTLVLYLRTGVTFQDGTPFNAEAVKFNIERINAEGSTVSDLKVIDEVEIVDDRTVKLHLNQPSPAILLAMTDRGGMMVSPTAVQQYGDDFSQHPVGAGPFKMIKHEPGGGIEYEAYADYWDKENVYLDKLSLKIIPEENSRINALRSGDIDIAAAISAQNMASLKNDSNLKLENRVSFLFLRMYVNAAMAPFDKKEVRLAVQHGINRQELIQAINFGEGEAANQAFPSGYWAHDNNVVINYDPEKSKQLLKDAGVDNVSFKLLRGPDAYSTRLAEAIKGQLEKVNITVEIEGMEPNAAVQEMLVKKTYPAMIGNWTGRADPFLTINSLYEQKSFYNVGQVSTPELDALLSEAAVTYDQNKRAELIGKISKIAILDEGYEIPLFFQPVISAMSKKVHFAEEQNLLGKALLSTLWVEQ